MLICNFEFVTGQVFCCLTINGSLPLSYAICSGKSLDTVFLCKPGSRLYNMAEGSRGGVLADTHLDSENGFDICKCSLTFGTSLNLTFKRKRHRIRDIQRGNMSYSSTSHHVCIHHWELILHLILHPPQFNSYSRHIYILKTLTLPNNK